MSIVSVLGVLACLVDGQGHGLSDASVLGIDRMVCSQSGCVSLVPLFPWSFVWQNAIVWCLTGLGGPGGGLGSSLIISL